MPRYALTAAAVVAGLTLSLTAGCSGSSSTSSNSSKPDAKALVSAGLAELNRGKQDNALGLFREAAAAQPNNVLAHYNIGVILQGRGKNVEALAAYGLAIAADPKYVPALFNEGTIYGVTNPALAITTYRRVIALQPKAPTAYLNLGLLEVNSGIVAQGVKDLQTALHQDPALLARLSPALRNQVRLTPAGASPSPQASKSP